jgi:hypothetical protein
MESMPRRIMTMTTEVIEVVVVKIGSNLTVHP